MKTAIKFFVFILIIPICSAQHKLEVFIEFPFDMPFSYISKDNGSEEGPGTCQEMKWVDLNHLLITNYYNRSVYILKNKTIGKVYKDVSPYSNNVSVYRSGFVVGPFDSTIPFNLFRINGEDLTEKIALIDETRKTRGGMGPYISENIVFSKDKNSELISWEILPDGKALFRNSKETKIWMTPERAEYFNYRIYKNSPTIGDYVIGMDYPSLWMENANFQYPQKEKKAINKSLDQLSFVGIDEKGNLYYFDISIPFNEISTTTKSFYVTFYIVDPWAKKIFFKDLGKDEWTPPRKKGYSGFYGTWPMAIHPNGDIYLFDIEEPKGVYQIKKLPNTWWKEMGVDTRKVGRINKNHIALQKEMLNKGENNGFVFENDYVWVVEESKTTGKVENKDYPWVKVRKMDGREGWLLAIYVNISN